MLDETDAHVFAGFPGREQSLQSSLALGDRQRTQVACAVEQEVEAVEDQITRVLFG